MSEVEEPETDDLTKTRKAIEDQVPDYQEIR